MWNPAVQGVPAYGREAEAAARALGVTVQLVEIRGPDDLETAFTAIVREHARAVSAMPDVPITFALHRKRIIEFAANNRRPL